jgi:DNA-binding winged helix-turn-helix (wHTH) protein
MQSGFSQTDFRLGEWLVEPTLNRISQNGASRHLEPKVMQVLVCLAEEQGRVVGKQKLMEKVWSDTFVTDDVLTRSISELRDAFGDDARDPKIIQTIPKVGYRLLATINTLPLDSANGNVAASWSITRWKLPLIRNERWMSTAMIVMLLIALTYLAVTSAASLFRVPKLPKIARIAQLTTASETRELLFTDGVRLYFNTLDRSLQPMQMSVSGGDATAVPTGFPVSYIGDVSADGTKLLVFELDSGKGKMAAGVPIWVVPALGGAPKRVGNVLAGEAYFSPDATQIVFTHRGKLFLVGSDGTGERLLATLEDGGYVYDAHWSGDRGRLRYLTYFPSKQKSAAWELSLAGGPPRRILTGFPKETRNMKAMPDGETLIISDEHGQLWALAARAPLSLRRPKPVRLTTGPVSFEALALSKDGKRIYGNGLVHQGELLHLDPKRAKARPYLNGISAYGVEPSPDGNWIAYVTWPEGVLWRSRPDGAQRVQLTSPGLNVFRISLNWSRDSKSILFMAYPDGRSRMVFRVSVEGGPVEQISPEGVPQHYPGYTADESAIVFFMPSTVGAPSPGLFEMQLATKSIHPFPGGEGLAYPVLSPDRQRMIALTEDDPRRAKLFDFGSQRWSELPIEGLVPWVDMYWRWSPDGQYVYFTCHMDIDKDGVKDRTIQRYHLATRRQELVASLKDIRQVPRVGRWFGFAPDGGLLLMRDVGTQHIYALELEETD